MSRCQDVMCRQGIYTVTSFARWERGVHPDELRKQVERCHSRAEYCADQHTAIHPRPCHSPNWDQVELGIDSSAKPHTLARAKVAIEVDYPEVAQLDPGYWSMEAARAAGEPGGGRGDRSLRLTHESFEHITLEGIERALRVTDIVRRIERDLPGMLADKIRVVTADQQVKSLEGRHFILHLLRCDLRLDTLSAVVTAELSGHLVVPDPALRDLLPKPETGFDGVFRVSRDKLQGLGGEGHEWIRKARMYVSFSQPRSSGRVQALCHLYRCFEAVHGMVVRGLDWRFCNSRRQQTRRSPLFLGAHLSLTLKRIREEVERLAECRRHIFAAALRDDDDPGGGAGPEPSLLGLYTRYLRIAWRRMLEPTHPEAVRLSPRLRRTSLCDMVQTRASVYDPKSGRHTSAQWEYDARRCCAAPLTTEELAAALDENIRAIDAHRTGGTLDDFEASRSARELLYSDMPPLLLALHKWVREVAGRERDAVHEITRMTFEGLCDLLQRQEEQPPTSYQAPDGESDEEIERQWMERDKEAWNTRYTASAGLAVDGESCERWADIARHQYLQRICAADAPGQPSRGEGLWRSMVGRRDPGECARRAEAHRDRVLAECRRLRPLRHRGSDPQPCGTLDDTDAPCTPDETPLAAARFLERHSAECD